MADNYLIRAQQVAAALESVVGTAETLTAANVKLDPFQADQLFGPDYSRFTNDEVAGDIGEAADSVAGLKGTISTGFVLQCSGAAATAPAIGTFLQACAMKLQVVHAITVGAISGGGVFTAGATYSATGGKTGIIETTRTGGGTLRYVVTSGGALANLDVVTVGADSATASGSDATYGQKYSPTSTSQQTLTLRRAIQHSEDTAGKDTIYELKGAMGKYTLTFTPHDVVRFAGEFQGVVNENGTEGDLFTGHTLEAKTSRPQFLNATVQLNGVAVKVASVTFDCGNDVQMDPDPTTTGGAAGYLQAFVARRAPTISFAPYKTTPTILDELALLVGGTSVPVVLNIDQGGAGKIFELQIPLAQVRGWSSGERAGKQIVELQLNVVRSTLTDLDYVMYFR